MREVVIYFNQLKLVDILQENQIPLTYHMTKTSNKDMGCMDKQRLHNTMIWYAMASWKLHSYMTLETDWILHTPVAYIVVVNDLKSSYSVYCTYLRGLQECCHKKITHKPLDQY